MSNLMKKMALAGAFAALLSTAAFAAGMWGGLPTAGDSQYPETLPLTGIEAAPFDTGLTQGLNPATELITTDQLAGYAGTVPSKANALIGGDATTNLFQRATTGSSVTTTLTYGGPDRWAYWSGTNTAMTVSRTTTAADLPAGVTAGFKMARTNGQTGVVQVCMLQALESSNSVRFQGQTAELSFYARAGATFTGASSQMNAYIVYGTGTDQSASSLAFAFNGGGGGSSTWTGQTNATVGLTTISTTVARYAVIANIPTTATQLAVILCWTPVGTAGANDYIAFSQIQLVPNPNLADDASATVGYACTEVQCSAFDNSRSQGLEAVRQYRYFYKLTETAAIAPIAPCAAIDVTHTNCLIQTPVVMRIAPTATFANGFATPTSTTQATLGACTTLAAATTVASTVGSVNTFLVNCTAATVPAAGVASFLYSNGGSGTISLTAEL